MIIYWGVIVASFSLSIYTVRIKERNKHSNALLANFDSEGSDLLDTFRSYLDKLKSNFSDDEALKKLLHVETLDIQDREVSGILETGEYGYEAQLYDKNTGFISYTRKTYEAEMLPFYFLIKIPKAADEGLIVLQRFNQFGIRNLLLDNFQKEVNEKFPDFRIDMYPVIPAALYEKYLREGILTKIRFIRFSIPTDIANTIREPHIEDDGYTELVVSAKRNRKLPTSIISKALQKIVNGEKEIKGIIELQSFEYDNVKIEVKINDKRRVIDLSNLQRIKWNPDVSDQVKLNETGHPDFASIDSIAKKLLDDISAEMFK